MGVTDQVAVAARARLFREAGVDWQPSSSKAKRFINVITSMAIE